MYYVSYTENHSPIPSTILQYILHVFPSLIYLAVHDSWLRLATAEIVGSSESQGSLENRNCIQGAPLCDSFLILSRFSSSWRVMALLGDAVCCANNLDVLESESPSLEMTHLRVFVSTITKSLSKLILRKWPLVKVEITLIKTERREKASETFSGLCEWILLPHSLVNLISISKQFSS